MTLGDFQCIKYMDICYGQSGMNQRFFEVCVIFCSAHIKACKEKVHWQEELVHKLHK